MSRYYTVVLSVLFVVMVDASALGQTLANGSVRGYVRDEQTAVLPGVVVTASSHDAPGTYTSVTDGEGFYRLLDLPPGNYTISAELQGFSRFVQENVLVRAGLNLGLDVTMRLGALTEVVTVKAETPMLESAKPSQAVNISGDFQRSLSLTTRRHWSDFLLLTPGVVNTFSTQISNMYAHGSDVGSHVFQLDGADVTSAGLASPVYSYMSSEVLQDVQVKTGGAEAATPLGQGAVVSMVSRSGSNTFRGTGFLLFQRKGWSSNNNPGGTTSAFGLVQPDVSLGGPLWRERAWFFGAYRSSALDQGVSRSPEQVATLKALVPGYEPFDQEQDARAAFFKVTAQASAVHQFMGFFEHSRQESKYVQAIHERPFAKSTIGGPSMLARWTSVLGSSAGLKLGVTYNNLTNPNELVDWNVASRTVYTGVMPSGGRLLGSGPVAALGNNSVGQESNSDKLTFTGDFNYYLRGWIGSHDLQTGVYLQPKRLSEFPARYPVGPDGVSLEYLVLRDHTNPAAGAIPFLRRTYDSDRFMFRSVMTTNYAWYVQDAWRPATRLTVSAGLRVDRIARTDRSFDVTVQETTAVGPRVGINYVLTEDGRNTIRGSWGRVHESVSSGSSAAAGNVSAGYRDAYDLDLDGVFETEFVTPAVSALTLNRVIDLDGYHQPHVNEWIVGYQRQLPGQVSADVSVIRRDFRNRAANVDANGIYEAGVFRGYANEALNEIYRVTSNTWNWPVYTGLQLQVAKQTSQLQILASYVRQWRHVAGTWQPNDPASFIQPDAFPNDKGIGDGRVLSTNSLSGSADALNEKWRDHAIRVAGAYQAPWGVRMSSSVVMQSGVWSGPIVTRIAVPDPRFGPSIVRLSNGRAVSNPLATTIRFAHPTRGDEQLTTPWIVEWNLHLSREFRVGGIRIQPGLDVLNLPNADGDQAMMTGANQLYSTNYGKFQLRQPPRSVQVSARLAF